MSDQTATRKVTAEDVVRWQREVAAIERRERMSTSPRSPAEQAWHEKKAAKHDALADAVARQASDLQAIAKALLQVRLEQLSDATMIGACAEETAHVCWGAVLDSGYRDGNWSISAEEAAELKRLADLAGGWWADSDRFVTLDQWREEYAKRQEGNDGADA